MKSRGVVRDTGSAPLRVGVDEEGCKESALLSRMPGCGIFQCEKKEFDAFDVVINKAGETKSLEGAVEQLKFVCPASNSHLQLQRNIEAALKKAGYTVVLRARSKQRASESAAATAISRPSRSAGSARPDPRRATITACLLLGATAANAIRPVVVNGPVNMRVREWDIPTLGSRPHDAHAGRDGSIWWTGQYANRLGRLDPTTSAAHEYVLQTPSSGPHGLVGDADGNIWYTGNGNGTIDAYGAAKLQTGKSVEHLDGWPNARPRGYNDVRYEIAGDVARGYTDSAEERQVIGGDLE